MLSCCGSGVYDGAGMMGGGWVRIATGFQLVILNVKILFVFNFSSNHIICSASRFSKSMDDSTNFQNS